MRRIAHEERLASSSIAPLTARAANEPRFCGRLPAFGNPLFNNLFVPHAGSQHYHEARYAKENT